MKRGSNRWPLRVLVLAMGVVLAGCIGLAGGPLGELQSWLESAEGEEILAQLEDAGFDVDAGELEQLGPELLEALWTVQGYATILHNSVEQEWAGDRQLVAAGG